MKKDLAIILGLFLLVLSLILFGGQYSSLNFFGGGAGGNQTQTQKESTTISVKTLTVNADIAATAGDRKKGLSGREDLEINRGMLFVFDQSGNYPIWMKDMKFPIDIIWIDENKKIVYIVPTALPEPGKKDNGLTVYKPDGDARYILEINAGLATANNLQVGDTVNLGI
ncbi:MAG: DUF192 domain-containing protein [Candidatus Curtissbacteria bacterium]